MSGASANARGIRFMLVAVTCLALNDTCNKFLVATMPASEVVALRAMLGAMIVLAVMAVRSEFRHLKALFRPHIMIRSLAESWIGPLLIIALAFMPQADVTAIYMVSPVLVAMVGFGGFKEKFRWSIVIAIVAALAGAWLFVNPGGEAIQTVALLPLGAAMLQTVREYISRTMGRRAEGGEAVPNRVVALCTALFALLTAAILYFFFPWATPIQAWHWPEPAEWAVLAASATLFYLGVTCIYEAFRGSDLSVVAPFRYWYLMVAVISGVVIFGEIPGLRSIVGMLIIVGAGVLILWQQHRPARN